MINKCKEEDFDQIKSVSLGRLSTSSLSGFFWGVFAFSAVMTVVAFGGLGSLGSGISTFIALMITSSLFLFLVQFVFTLFFTSKKIAFKFQKLQSVFLSFIGFKFSLDMYQFFFVFCEASGSPEYIKNTGFISLFGGIIFLIFSTFRAVKRVKQGELRNSGKGLYDFQNSKGYVSVPIIFGVTMFGGALGRYFSDMSSDVTVLFALLFAVVLQYSLALALPEFFLLTYCKFRFESFKVKRPDSRMRGSKR